MSRQWLQVMGIRYRNKDDTTPPGFVAIDMQRLPPATLRRMNSNSSGGGGGFLVVVILLIIAAGTVAAMTGVAAAIQCTAACQEATFGFSGYCSQLCWKAFLG